MVEPEMRLAFRVESPYWNCYLAGPSDMKEALLVGSVLLAFVEDKANKDLFMKVMQDGLGKHIRDIGLKVESWSARSAPEHERKSNG
jgi:hypothetical protein